MALTVLHNMMHVALMCSMWLGLCSANFMLSAMFVPSNVENLRNIWSDDAVRSLHGTEEG